MKRFKITERQYKTVTVDVEYIVEAENKDAATRIYNSGDYITNNVLETETIVKDNVDELKFVSIKEE